jgi:signal transduction histidine kinase
MNMSKTSTNRVFPLQLLLILPFLLQIFGAVGLVGYLSFKNGQRAVNDLATQLIERNSDVVNKHLTAYLSTPQKLNQLNADASRRGLLNVQDRQTVSQYFWDQMQAYDLSYIGLALSTGEGVGAARYDGKTISIDDWTAKQPDNNTNYATDQFGNRTQVNYRSTWNNFSEVWYAEPMAANKPIWTKIYTVNLPSGPYIAATASRPIEDAQNRRLGVIGADIHLLKLNDFLRNLPISQSGTVFLIERDGTLIANSGTEKPFTLVNNQVQRLRASDSSNPTIQTLAQHFQAQNQLQSTQSNNFQLKIQGENNYVHMMPWRDEYGLDWLVVLSVPETAFMTQINANTHMTIALCGGALVFASIMGLFTSRWITRPILRLNQASEAIAAGNLDQTVATSHIREFNALSHSFNHMAQRLSQLFTALEHSKEELEDRVEVRTTELKSTLDQLQQTQAQMIQSEKMSSLGQLVAGVAHEINNPVNFIYGNLKYSQEYTQDLQRLVEQYQKHYPEPVAEIAQTIEEIDLDYLCEDLPKMLASMKVGADRIREIVLSLRNFSRLDEAAYKKVDLHQGLDSTLMILQNRIKAKPGQTEIAIIKEYGVLPPVECYPGQLNQVFMNILSNSLDALEEGKINRTESAIPDQPKQITIRTALVDRESIEVTIADNGVGIPPEIQQRIFDPFFTTKAVGKGTGMGMSISYQIIEKHRGQIKCASTLGEGTKLTIRIPLQQTDPPVS